MSAAYMAKHFPRTTYQDDTTAEVQATQMHTCPQKDTSNWSTEQPVLTSRRFKPETGRRAIPGQHPNRHQKQQPA